MIYFAVFLAFVCYFYDILRKGAPLLMLLLGVGDGIAWQGTFRGPRQTGDGYRSALPLATNGTQECRGQKERAPTNGCSFLGSAMESPGKRRRLHQSRLRYKDDLVQLTLTEWYHGARSTASSCVVPMATTATAFIEFSDGIIGHTLEPI